MNKRIEGDERGEMVESTCSLTSHLLGDMVHDFHFLLSFSLAVSPRHCCFTLLCIPPYHDLADDVLIVLSGIFGSFGFMSHNPIFYIDLLVGTESWFRVQFVLIISYLTF